MSAKKQFISFYFSEISEVKPQSGQNNGLFVVIDTAISDPALTSVYDNYHGIQVSVNDRESIPLMSQSGFLVSPGYITRVEISATKMSVTSDLRYVPGAF